VLFTRDLRVHDHPALHAAVREAPSVVPLFVFDDALLAGRFTSVNRLAFLLEALRDLDHALRDRGSSLIVRRGDPVREVVAVAERVGARKVFVSADVSGFAQQRQRRMREACAAVGIEVVLQPGVGVVAAGAITPQAGDHFRVFTPYWNRWRVMPWRAVAPCPARLSSPPGLASSALPVLRDLTPGLASPDRTAGGERVARVQLERWLDGGLARYAERHDAVAVDGTSRLSPYIHFGCLSPLDIARRVRESPHGEAFLRQLCWRDFHHQVTAAFPAITRADYRPRGQSWGEDADRLAAWTEGRTGYPLVDAGMRQLRTEGWMHNRARLVTASFLVRDLELDWRLGAAHFFDLLVDGDIANNAGNWQWVAGTGNDTRPYRRFNPVRQSQRFDPEGEYIRRWVPELRAVQDARVHEPWVLPAAERRRLAYPGRVVVPPGLAPRRRA